MEFNSKSIQIKFKVSVPDSNLHRMNAHFSVKCFLFYSMKVSITITYSPHLVSFVFSVVLYSLNFLPRVASAALY